MPHIMDVFSSKSYIDLTMHQYGHATCDPLHAFGPAVRNHFLFHYIISGKGTLVSTNSQGTDDEYQLEGGHGFLIWPGQRNTYIADQHDPWAYVWIEFDGLKAQELIVEAGLGYDHPIYISHNNVEKEKLKQEMLTIAQDKNLMSVESIGHLYLFLGALINSSSMRKKVAGGNLREFYVREAIAYIEQHYQSPITVEDIASYCNLNRGYLSKIFGTVLSTPPQAFLVAYRLNKACELLKITNKPIGEISAMVGYHNQLHFSRTFRQKYGIPPSLWRQQNKLR